LNNLNYLNGLNEPSKIYLTLTRAALSFSPVSK
jgi:hypothetical protein